MDAPSIKDSLATHGPDLMGLAGVVGVAEGALEDGTSCILVLAERRTVALEAALPSTLDGHPVVLHVAGELEAR